MMTHYNPSIPILAFNHNADRYVFHFGLEWIKPYNFEWGESNIQQLVLLENQLHKIQRP
jgi:hypothetical protein